MLRRSGDSTRKSSADPEAPFEMFLMRKIGITGCKQKEHLLGSSSHPGSPWRGKGNPLRTFHGEQNKPH